jgi:large subunit ribosomal protein L4
VTAAPKAPLLDASGKKSKDVALAEGVFAVAVRPHLLHEAVRAEAAAARSGTRAAKTRALVSGGRSKPWRQKGTGRARAGTTRAPQWTGGGIAFPPGMRSFEVKVNRKARRSAFRAALTAHAARGTLAVVDGGGFDPPSTKQAGRLLEARGVELPLLVVVDEQEDALTKSFRNLERVVVTVPGELEVASIVWARSLLISQAALGGVNARAGITTDEGGEPA